MEETKRWNRVKSLRKELGLNQVQVAAGADIAISTLWAAESGFDAKTSPETKRKIADFLNCEIDDIFPAEMIGDCTLDEALKKMSK